MDEMTNFRNAIDSALDDEVISQEEAGFIVTLASRFREDIERKSRAMLALQGEIAQLKANEKVILDIVSNMVAAQKRAEDRERTMRELKEGNIVRKGVAIIENNETPIEQSDIN
jgi:hypothetical protein